MHLTVSHYRWGCGLRMVENTSGRNYLVQQSPGKGGKFLPENYSNLLGDTETITVKVTCRVPVKNNLCSDYLKVRQNRCTQCVLRTFLPQSFLVVRNL